MAIPTKKKLVSLDLDKVLVVGQKMRVVYDGRIEEEFEIRGIVDNQFVIREWVERKQRWKYRCESLAFFTVNNRENEPCLEIVK